MHWTSRGFIRSTRACNPFRFASVTTQPIRKRNCGCAWIAVKTDSTPTDSMSADFVSTQSVSIYLPVPTCGRRWHSPRLPHFISIQKKLSEGSRQHDYKKTFAARCAAATGTDMRRRTDKRLSARRYLSENRSGCAEGHAGIKGKSGELERCALCTGAGGRAALAGAASGATLARRTGCPRLRQRL